MRRHHRRRLERHGWHGVLDRGGLDGWATADPPPREGNLVEVLIDGEAYFPALIEAIESAERFVHVAGWALDPDFQLRRGESSLTVRELLSEAAKRVDVRVLLWAGAPAPVMKPTRSEVREIAARLTKGTQIQCGRDSHERPMHCHHEKIVVIDGRIAFVGGIDLTALSGDRYDSPTHPYRGSIGWHDVSTRVAGPAVADVANHFALRWFETTGEHAPTAEPSGPVGASTVQVVRTVPDSVYRHLLPQGDYRLLDAYRGALQQAQNLIYIESQFLWSPEIVAIIGEKLVHPPGDEFRVLLILPARPQSGNDDTRGQLALLEDCDRAGGGGRLLACALFAHRGAERAQIYVHAKVAVIDDRWLTIGSANLNDHSLFNDSEMNIVTDDAELATATRHRLWAEHLQLPITRVSGEPHHVIDSLFAPTAQDQLDRHNAKTPTTNRLIRQTAGSRRVEHLLGPLDSLAVDG